MAKRIKLADRILPRYCKGEEIMNMVTHIVGGALGIGVLLLCLLKARGTAAVVGSVIYGCSMIALYAATESSPLTATGESANTVSPSESIFQLPLAE